MPMSTSWYYKPVNSPRYPSLNLELSQNPNLKRIKSAGSLSSRETTAVSPESRERFLARISRPTVSSIRRFDSPRLNFTYENRVETWNGQYLWNRMAYFADDRSCLWSRHGYVRPPTRT